MNFKHWMFAALASGMVATAAQAQAPAAPQDVNNPPVIPAGDTPAPLATKPSAKKTDANKKAAPAKKVTAPEPVKAVAPLTAGPAVAREKNVNVRGQAYINSEVVTHLKRGDVVTVIEEVTRKAKTDEPGRWAKIALPSGTVVWASTQFINADTKAVIPKRLNVRSGPGENYSVLGRIDKGTVLKTIETKGDWTKIEAPEGCYAFVAAHLLSTDPADLGPALAKANPPAPAAPVVAATPPPPPPTEVAIVTPTPVVTQPAEPVAVSPAVQAPPPTPAVVLAPPPPPAAEPVPVPAPETPAEPAVEEPPIKRIVTREGIVKGSASIQAPTYFVLRSLDNNKTINYLHSPDTNIVFKAMQFQRVLVTGEEVLDERWPNTPVVIIDSIEVVPQ